ncbi:MAG: tRNA threonylcarbamoyladenosine dehydratase [Firmicutes bacterium]|nr:tRNA threonylcarbamoyladenosine dehydratase [Bacillota bacterium]
MNQFSRSEILWGAKNQEKLAKAKVIVFGIGGVGGYAVEALARAGIGSIALVDDDKVCLTNINRQLHATHDTIGKYKTEVAKERILAINPNAKVEIFSLFYTKETANVIDISTYDYILDAIDTVSCKLELIERSKANNVPIISCMGAGNKLDASSFEVADIFETTLCPLAKVMRKELRARGIDNLKVVYSKEVPIVPIETVKTSCKHNCICPPDTARTCCVRRQIPGSVSFVPSVAGLIMAGEIVIELIK